jgi:hypothetical protein
LRSRLRYYNLHEFIDIPEHPYAVREECVRASAIGKRKRARHTPHVATGFQGVAGRDEGAPFLGRFHDDHLGEACDNSVSRRESPLQRQFPEVVLGEDGSPVPNAFEEAARRLFGYTTRITPPEPTLQTLPSDFSHDLSKYLGEQGTKRGPGL